MGKLNLNDLAEDFPEVEEGTYDFEIVSGQFRTSKSGRPMVNWRLQVGKASVFYNTLLPSPGETTGYGFLRDLVLGIGADPNDFELDDEDPEGTAEELISALIGETGMCKVTVENDRRNVRILKPKK